MSASVPYRAVALAAGLIVAALLVAQLVTVLLALTLTVIISLPLSSAASFAARRGLPRGLGAAVALLSALAVLGGIGFLVIPQFISQTQQFANSLPTTVTDAERYLHDLTGLSTKMLNNDLTQFVQGYTRHPQRLIGPLSTIGISLAGIIAGFVVMLITALYIATNPEPLRGAMLRLLVPEMRPTGEQVMRRVQTAWQGWLTAMAIDMLVLGGLLYVGMQLIGLNFALGFAVFSAVLTVIPNYGSIISAVPPVLFGLSQSPGTAALVLLLYVIVNQIEGNLILPLVMARTVDLHPALVAIGVLVMAQLFGIFGVVLAIPLMSLILILVDELWVIPQEAHSLVVRQ
jgi:predicted PurR-regulated permease PerM